MSPLQPLYGLKFALQVQFSRAQLTALNDCSLAGNISKESKGRHALLKGYGYAALIVNCHSSILVPSSDGIV